MVSGLRTGVAENRVNDVTVGLVKGRTLEQGRGNLGSEVYGRFP